jgi:hypothetical protein
MKDQIYGRLASNRLVKPVSKNVLGRYRGKLFLILATLVVVAFALVTYAARAWRDKKVSSARQGIVATQPVRGRLQHRLALQPEADRQRRRLGQRFLAPGREVSVEEGIVTLGSDRWPVRIIRSQDDDDERLTFALGDGTPALTWSGVDGARSNGDQAIGDLRKIIERLALDNPDQFVLAQLRGASYPTVARNARPEEAGSALTYNGPVWDLVRVAEPSKLTQNRPQSLWRLYYINTSTGLIDKVVSEEQGQTITAEISDWVTQNGETIPTRTIWKLNGQTVMELTLTNFTHNPKQ